MAESKPTQHESSKVEVLATFDICSFGIGFVLELPSDIERYATTLKSLALLFILISFYTHL